MPRPVAHAPPPGPGHVTIDPRFCGPPDVGNGGYVSGLLAREVPGPARVTLMAPAPLGKALQVEPDARGRPTLLDGETVIARAEPTTLDFAMPTPPLPAWAGVESRAGSSRAFLTHPFPGDFVCGPDRAPGDGLRIFPGPVPGTEQAAAPWVPAPDLADATGVVRPEFVWAALDSPSSFPLLEDAARASALEPMVLGRLEVARDADVRAGEPYLLLTWPLALEGRRATSAVTLYDGEQRVAARGRATWISIAGQA